jgi:phytanoyl-CoA hydroxylase
MPGLTAAQRERYLEEGYLLLPGLLPAAAFAPLRAELEERVEALAREQHAAGLLPELFPHDPFETRLANLYRASREPAALWRALHGKHLKTDGLFQLFTHPALLDLAESLLGPEVLAHPQFNLRAKLPDHEATVVPWHQDLGYLEAAAAGTLMVNCWIPLVDAPMEAGPLQVIPGSHRWGLLPHERLPGAGGYLGLRAETLPPHTVVDCPAPLGTVLLLLHCTVHRSRPNTSGRVRWSLDLRYSDPRRPTGRAGVPGFLARSRAHPERVLRNGAGWRALFPGE